VVLVVHYQEVVKHSKNYYVCKKNLKKAFSVFRTVGGYAEKLPCTVCFPDFFFRARSPKEVIYVYIAVRKALEKPH
jgi:hypothetical protein